MGHRTRQDLETIAGVLEVIWRYPGFTHHRLGDESQPPMPLTLEDGTVRDCWPEPNDIDLLQSNLPDVDLSQFDEPADLQAFELFGVLALHFIHMAHVEEGRALNSKTPDWIRVSESHLADLIDEYAADAKQAIVAANQSRVLARVQGQQRLERAREAGRARHKAALPLKSAVSDLYALLASDQGDNQSNRRAAIRIMADLEKSGRLHRPNDIDLHFDGQLALRTDDPLKRIEKWIGQIRRRLQK